MSQKIYIAIDPGWNGALALRAPDGTVTCTKSPDTIAGIVQLLKLLFPYGHSNDVTAIIEKVHSMPGDGVKSVWRFAENTTAWKASLVAAEIPFKEIRPQVWMKKMGGLPKDKDKRKRRLKEIAQQMFPKIKVTLWNADALCMLSTMYSREAKEREEKIARLLS